MDDLSIVARELRAARDRLKLTREHLAEKIGYTAGYIEKIETGKLAATVPFIDAAAKVLGDGIDAAGLFRRLRDDEKREIIPDWFRPWREHEQVATEIRTYESHLVPGLLQTEDYATALLGDPERVSARLDRQQVLERAQMVVVVAEAVLRYRVGDHAVMAEQLRVMAETPATVHVLPSEAETHLGADGGFTMASVDGSTIGYVDTPARGFVLPDDGVVSQLERRWQAILAESLPRSLSRELILREAERWSGSWSGASRQDQEPTAATA